MLVTSFNLVYNSARSRAFKRNMLGTYGAKATGISPGTTWPTPRDIHLGEWVIFHTFQAFIMAKE